MFSNYSTNLTEQAHFVFKYTFRTPFNQFWPDFPSLSVRVRNQCNINYKHSDLYRDSQNGELNEEFDYCSVPGQFMGSTVTWRMVISHQKLSMIVLVFLKEIASHLRLIQPLIYSLTQVIEGNI